MWPKLGLTTPLTEPEVEKDQTAEVWGVPYEGQPSTQLKVSHRESHYIDLVSSRQMALPTARRLLAAIDPDTPWLCRADFAQAMAALVSVFAAEMRRKSHAGAGCVGDMMAMAVLPGRAEWYFNHIRRAHMYSGCRALPSGTTANEAFHSEVNRWYRNQPCVYHGTVALQLGIGVLAKGLAHSCALYRPTLRQEPPAVMLTVIASGLAPPAEAWRAWCAGRRGVGEIIRRNPSQLLAERNRLRDRIRSVDAKLRKRPAARAAVVLKKPAACPVKRRTAFTSERRGSLRRVR